MSGEAQQAASGGCIAASPRRVPAQHSAKRETNNVNVRMLRKIRFVHITVKGTRHMYGMLSGISCRCS
jgi:hypothetical protein